jgi:hypothetical protein
VPGFLLPLTGSATAEAVFLCSIPRRFCRPQVPAPVFFALSHAPESVLTVGPVLLLAVFVPVSERRTRQSGHGDSSSNIWSLLDSPACERWVFVCSDFVLPFGTCTGFIAVLISSTRALINVF